MRESTYSSLGADLRRSAQIAANSQFPTLFALGIPLFYPRGELLRLGHEISFACVQVDRHPDVLLRDQPFPVCLSIYIAATDGDFDRLTVERSSSVLNLMTIGYIARGGDA